MHVYYLIFLQQDDSIVHRHESEQSTLGVSSEVALDLTVVKDLSEPSDSDSSALSVNDAAMQSHLALTRNQCTCMAKILQHVNQLVVSLRVLCT